MPRVHESFKSNESESLISCQIAFPLGLGFEWCDRAIFFQTEPLYGKFLL